MLWSHPTSTWPLGNGLETNNKRRLDRYSQFFACFRLLFVHKLLTALLQKLVGDFFFFAGKFCGKIYGNFAGFLRTHEVKAQKLGENIGAFFERNFVAQTKIFRANSFCRRATLTKAVPDSRTQKFTTMKFEVFEGESCGGCLVELISCQFLPRTLVFNLAPKSHHILHTEVHSKQRHLSPSTHSGSNLT